jgi:hypothetical protein
MTKRLLLTLFLLSIIGFYTGCNQGANTQEAAATEVLEEPADDVGDIPAEMVDLLTRIPPPQDAPKLLREAGANYEEKLLNPSDKGKNYRVMYDQSVNMGIYTADMAYSSVFDKKQIALKYMKAVRDLAKNLDIAGVFDKKWENRVDRNKDNQDSLDVIFNETFTNLREKLKADKRESILILIFTGAWVESAHLAVQHWKLNPSKAVVSRISSHRTSLQDLLQLLDAIKKESGVPELFTQLSSLRPHFSLPEDLKAEVPDAELTDKQLKDLDASLTTIRNDLVK